MFRKSILSFLLFLGTQAAWAKIQIVTTVPSLRSLIAEVVQGEGEVKSLCKGHQDAHFVDAKPSFTVLLRNADLVVAIGNELEVGWLPPLLINSKNPKIQGSKGYLEVAQFVDLLDVPQKKLDRSDGDVHPGGNPHFMTDPRNGLKVLQGITEHLIQQHPEHQKSFQTNFDNYKKKLETKIADWEKSLAPLKGRPMITHHKSWTYFLNWVGAKEFATVEDKPGITPSPKHLSSVVAKARGQKAPMPLLIEGYYSPELAETLASQIGGKVYVLPNEVEALPEIKTYEDLFEKLVNIMKNIPAEKAVSVAK